MKKRHTFLFFIFSLCSATALMALPADADTQYSDAAAGFDIQIPEGFEKIPSKQEQHALLLRSGSGFPTFNVLKQPGNLQDQGNACKAILDDYRKVGITDAKLKKTFPLHSATSKETRNICELSFTNQKQLVTAWVSVIDSRDKHFILTYMDSSEGSWTKTPETLFETFALK